MAHAWDHEQAEEILGLSQGALPIDGPGVVGDHVDHAVEIIDRCHGRNIRITPAMINNEFGAVVAEPPQIRIIGIHGGTDFFQGIFQVLVEVEAAKIPVGIIEHKPAEETFAAAPVQGPIRFTAGYPGGPATRRGFATGDQAGIDQFTGGISDTGPYFFDGADLFRCQAGVVVGAGGAGESRRLEIAGERVLQDAILDTVDGIACHIHGVA